MSPLSTGKRNGRTGGGSLARLHLDLQPLMAKELEAGPLLLSARPVAPEQRRRAALARMEQHTHPAWMLGLVSVPLTLRTFRARAAVGDAGLIDDAQTAITLPTTFLGKERISCWTTHTPIWLENKVRF